MKFIDSLVDNIKKNREIKENYYKQSGENFFSAFFNIGARGEFATYKKINQIQGCNRCIANCYVPKGDGNTTELDLILIHETGIYVFESKNYSGYIFGSSDQKMWTQTLYAGRRGTEKHQFYNPIWQNNKHIKYLKDYLNCETSFYSYIVFSERCDFKRMDIKGNARVIQRYDLLYQLNKDIQSRHAILTEEEIEYFHMKLLQLSGGSKEDKQVHIQNIKNEFNYNQNKIENHICPVCGGNLVLRTAKKGANIGSQFYGCSNYPKCKFTIK